MYVSAISTLHTYVKGQFIFFSILGKKGSFSIYVKYFKYFKSVIKTEIKIYVQRYNF